MNFLLNLDFEHDYRVELIEHLPATANRIKQLHFSGISGVGGRDSILIKVIPGSSSPWIGVFSGEYISPESVTGVFSSPDRNIVCVVSFGRGYFVRTDSPEIWSKVQSFPITGVYPIYKKNLIVFSDFTRLVAYQTQEVKWITPRLSCDGLTVVKITDEFIEGLGMDLVIDKQVRFFVEITTGKCMSGAGLEAK